MALLITQTFSQRTWPKVGDIDDCWVLAWMQCQVAVAPWLPWLDTTEARRFAGNPDDGVADGNAGGVDDMVRGIRAATPKLGELITPLRGSWAFPQLLAAIKGGSTPTTVRPFAAAVMGAALPKVYTRVPHQVTIFHEPGVGLYVADPMAPDRSEPYRIATAAAERALASFAAKPRGILFPSIESAFKTHPLYVASSAGKFTQDQVDAAVAAARADAVRPLEARLAAVRALADQIRAI